MEPVKEVKISDARAKRTANKIAYTSIAVAIIASVFCAYALTSGLFSFFYGVPIFWQNINRAPCYQLALIPLFNIQGMYSLTNINPTSSGGCGLYSYRGGTIVSFSIAPSYGYVNPNYPTAVMLGTYTYYPAASGLGAGQYAIWMLRPTTEYIIMQRCLSLQLVPLFGISSYALTGINPLSSGPCSAYGNYWYVPNTAVTFDLTPNPGYINPVSSTVMEGTYNLYPTATGSNTGGYLITMTQDTKQIINMQKGTPATTTTVAPPSSCPNYIYTQTMTLTQIEACAGQAGFSGTPAQIMIGIAWGESGFNAQDASGLLGNNDNTDCRGGLNTCYNPASCASGATNWHLNPTCEFNWAAGYVTQWYGIACPSGGNTYCYWSTYWSANEGGGRAAYCLTMPTSYSGYNCPSGLNDRGWWA